MFRKGVQISSYYVLPVLLVLVSIGLADHELFSKFGEIALLMLAGILFIKPMVVLLPIWIFQIPMTYRREMGIVTFWFFAFHSIGLYWVGAYQVSDVFDPRQFVFFGGLAGIGMTLLAVTANDFSVRVLKRNWKKLHRLAYLILFLGLYHSGLATGEWWKAWVLGGGFLMLKVLQYAKTKRL